MMSKAKPVIVPLHQLQPGTLADFYAMLVSKTSNTTRDGKPFFNCSFRDLRRTVSVAIWQDSGWFSACEVDWQVGGFYKIRGSFHVDDRYGPKIDIQQIRPVNEDDRKDGFVESDYNLQSRFDVEALYKEIVAIAEKEIADEPLKKLTLAILEQHKDVLPKLPASPRQFFPFPGGWLEHTLSVTKNCVWLVDRYAGYYAELTPPLNRNLVIAGAILHEIGRVAEWQTPEIPGITPEQSVPGRLFGHSILARDLLRDAARNIPELNVELLSLLEHLVLTHLALPEWGSPRLPAIPEVLIIHHADDLDAKLEMYVRCLRTDPSAGPLTDRDPILGRQLLKTRTS